MFVALFLRMLKLGGRCACIVPNGVLFRSNAKAYRELRRELVDDQHLEAVIYMPSGVFKPYSGVSTAVLVFTKTDAPGSTQKMWLYDMHGDGFTLDDKRTEDPAHDDIPDIVERFRHLDLEETRTHRDRSFFVTRDEIVANDYDLSFNKYAEVEVESEEYPPTVKILAQLRDLGGQLMAGLEELSSTLGKERE